MGMVTWVALWGRWELGRVLQGQWPFPALRAAPGPEPHSPRALSTGVFVLLALRAVSSHQNMSPRWQGCPPPSVPRGWHEAHPDGMQGGAGCRAACER